MQEFYSSQTRQTKTALIISSSTLLALVAFGRDESDVSLPPWGVLIESLWVLPIAWGVALYFLVSYWVAVSHERSGRQRTKHLEKVQRWVDTLAEQAARAREMISEKTRDFEAIQGRAAKSRDKLLQLADTSDSQNFKSDIHELYEECVAATSNLHYIRQSEYIPSSDYPDRADVNKSIDDLNKRYLGFEGFRVNFMDTYLPILYSACSVFVGAFAIIAYFVQFYMR